MSNKKFCGEVKHLAQQANKLKKINMINIKFHSFYNEFDSEMSRGELEVIADYLQDADYITAKSRKNFITLVEHMPQKSMVMLKGNDALDYICVSKEPHTEKSTEKLQQDNGMTKLFRVEADGMYLNPENTDLSFMDSVKDKNLTFKQAIGIVRKCVPVVWGDEHVKALKEIDNIYKQMKRFEPGHEKKFVYRITDDFDFNYIRIKRVA